MSNKFNALTVNAYVYLTNLMDYVKKLERGDADSSGSTLRTMGIVLLVVAVVLVLGTAVLLAARGAATSINAATFSTFKQ
jgi:hypothetical protein